ncbi:uncharacterized protein FOMMEDRAFT_74045, partial [Fomitiporia mediterranea MF3/22]|uniref:uncharacterized protein n=1 Tax=Fomitiporia mediterranea (strain MF3/22) TaxID=694068 RepID=UPI0004409A8C
VATWWNSDFACIESYLLLYPVVEQLISVQHLKLQNFILNSSQQTLVQDLLYVLSVIEVPLISDVIPMLLDICQALECVSKDENLSNILHIAARAGILVCDKYFTLTRECEVYFITIIMLLDKKLEWFTKRNFPETVVQEIQSLIIQC